MEDGLVQRGERRWVAVAAIAGVAILAVYEHHRETECSPAAPAPQERALAPVVREAAPTTPRRAEPCAKPPRLTPVAAPARGTPATSPR